MKRFRVGRPTPALVISVVALCLAMGGTAYAVHKIGSAQVKNHSLQGKDLRNHTLTAKQINENKFHRIIHFAGIVPAGQTKTIATIGPFKAQFTCNDGGVSGQAGWVILNTGADNSLGQGSDNSELDFDTGESVLANDDDDPDDEAGAISPSRKAVTVYPAVSKDANSATAPLTSSGCVGAGVVFNDGK